MKKNKIFKVESVEFGMFNGIRREWVRVFRQANFKRPLEKG
ncbi:hypothetical protein oki1106_11060 [Helicobacter pylori]